MSNEQTPKQLSARIDLTDSQVSELEERLAVCQAQIVELQSVIHDIHVYLKKADAALWIGYKAKEPKQ